MRLDKFLKVSRIIKRRTVAQQACDADKVLLNGKEAKPSAKVKVGDIIEVTFGQRTTRYEVLELRDSATIEQAASMIRPLGEKR
ncbi:MAG: RNA-binding S4 domain-containing protein [Clostridia bacterium]|nr:RNA-binding S4 domain-containing protein [Clostridia bacterium]